MSSYFLFYIVGVSLVSSALLMIPSLLMDIMLNGDILTFSIPATLSFMLGVVFLIMGEKKSSVSVKRSFSSSILGLISFTLMSSLPFRVNNPSVTFTDSFFEAMSGITTTGATVFDNLHLLPHSILLWRSMLHLVGGLGVIIVSLILLSVTNLAEIHTSTRRYNKLYQVSGVYMVLVVLCSVAYYFSGMSVFDSFCHAASTVATAGFANYDESFAYFNNPLIEFFAIFFIVLSSLPFTSYTRLIQTKSISAFRTEQIFFFFIISASISFLMYNIITSHITDITEYHAWRYSSFITASMISTTGFGLVDYEAWNISSLQILILFTMFIGGCTGSSAGGIKTLRLLVLIKTLRLHVMQHLNPSDNCIKVDGKVISNDFIFSIVAFFFIYIITFAFLALLLSLTGIDFITSISAAASSITNSGPGLGTIIGPAGNYASFPIYAKWLYITGMFLGRLEIISVITFFTIIAKRQQDKFD